MVVNSDLRKKFNLKTAEFAQAGFTDTEWAFHGSTRDSIKIISETGFLHPDDLNKKKAGMCTAFFYSIPSMYRKERIVI